MLVAWFVHNENGMTFSETLTVGGSCRPRRRVLRSDARLGFRVDSSRRRLE
jgi:hypothetical protein